MADTRTTKPTELRGAYITLDASDKVLSTDSVTAAMWSGNTPTLQVFQTSSAQVTSAVKEYYTSVYQTASTGVTAAIQFDVAYNDIVGSGSIPLNALVVGTTPTRINYGSYRNLVLGDENASFISSSTGAILFDSFIDNPTTYITSVGLYNDAAELLAVAKLSRPLEKDFTKELLVRVKLDF